MLALKGNYILKLNFGEEDVGISPGNIKEFVIIQDINRYLPSFSIQLIDSDGVLTHLTPFDRKLSRIHVQVGRDIKDPEYNDFDFTVYARNPVGESDQSNVYSIEGLLTTDGLFSPSHCRGFVSISSMLTILKNELDCDNLEISANLNFKKSPLQANWNNTAFLDHLKDNLVGSDGESAFQIYVKRKNGRSSLFCKNLKSIFNQPILYKFIIGNDPVEDFYPAMNYEIFDNYKIFGAFASKRQRYQYFDYTNSAFKSESLDAVDMYASSEYFLIDNDDVSDSNAITDVGRVSSSKDLLYLKSGYHNKLNSLTKLWAVTWGLINLCPGDMVLVFFPQGSHSGDMLNFQYSGIWMVERIVHSFTDTHVTRMLLTRTGLNTDRGCTLLHSQDWRR